MNDMNTLKNQEIICHCSGTTKETITALLSSNITDLDAISRKTGACSGCGSCESSVLELIADLTQ
ncbi:MAG: (2Fe-2S)-binding protein [Methylococcales bacterium]|nr:MAG: (2Fe-2S)-binding protein [Methylococcales bacterium]